MKWRRRLEAYYVQMGLDHDVAVLSSNRTPFDDKMCDLVVEFQPEVVSFHFGLPDRNLLSRVRRTGAKCALLASVIEMKHTLPTLTNAAPLDAGKQHRRSVRQRREQIFRLAGGSQSGTRRFVLSSASNKSQEPAELLTFHNGVGWVKRP